LLFLVFHTILYMVTRMPNIYGYCLNDPQLLASLLELGRLTNPGCNKKIRGP
jgi:hypothetical protein